MTNCERDLGKWNKNESESEMLQQTTRDCTQMMYLPVKTKVK